MVGIDALMRWKDGELCLDLDAIASETADEDHPVAVRWDGSFEVSLAGEGAPSPDYWERGSKPRGRVWVPVLLTASREE